jgi:hypothetical protein
VLEFHLRSSEGGRQEIRLPQGAQLLSVQIDNRSQPIRQEGSMVSLPVHPGPQTYRLNWRQSSGIEAVWNSPEIDLGLESVNSEIQIELGRDRWLLFTSGPTLGPAVLFWGELSIILLAALILGRLRDYSPLGTISWLLLGIGLSQVSIWSGLLVVATFFAFGYRRRLAPKQLGGSFNLLQIALVLLPVDPGNPVLGLTARSVGSAADADRRQRLQRLSPQLVPGSQRSPAAGGPALFRTPADLSSVDAGLGPVARLCAVEMGRLGLAGLQSGRVLDRDQNPITETQATSPPVGTAKLIYPWTGCR